MSNGIVIGLLATSMLCASACGTGGRDDGVRPPPEALSAIETPARVMIEWIPPLPLRDATYGRNVPVQSAPGGCSAAGYANPFRSTATVPFRWSDPDREGASADGSGDALRYRIRYRRADAYFGSRVVTRGRT